MVKRSKVPKKEKTQLQKLKEENKRLKREISDLKKQIKRIEDWKPKARDLKAVMAKHDKQHAENPVKNKRKCHKCPEGFLSLILLPTLNGVKYFRKCNKCSNRTRTKEYHEGVKK